MKTVGIIAEYNPFHFGHAWQIAQAKALSGADFAVIAMSPDFVQRGTPALTDKWSRARAALTAGADLVLELPVRAAVGSAEYFAQGGVSLLGSLGVVDALSFGCEAEDPGILSDAAHFFAAEESPQYQEKLREGLRAGMTYPGARTAAYLSCTETSDRTAGEESRIRETLSQPNNILAIEYLRACQMLGIAMETVPVARRGAGYHDPSAEQKYSSASAIRSALEQGRDVRSFMPPEAGRILEHEIGQGRFVTGEDMSLLLHARLLDLTRGNNTEKALNNLSSCLDVGEDLAARIRNMLCEYQGYEQFTALLKTRQITETRVRRALIHILLGLKKDSDRRIRYARVLGFRRDAGELLRGIRERTSVPLITKLADAPDFPGLEEDLEASCLWEMLAAHKTEKKMRSEYRRQLQIL